MWSIAPDSKGIGLRSDHLADLCGQPRHPHIDFLELAPDNWMDIGGARRTMLDDIAGRYPLVAHGLNLSIGDLSPLNLDYLANIRRFLDEYQIAIYSDHLSFCRDEQGYLYDLLPVPRFAENIDYLAGRIRQVVDILDRPLVLENISWYHGYAGEMPEIEFWLALLEKSPCEMLLDINNVWVNAQNHGYDALSYIRALPGEKIRYYHIAGHLHTPSGLLDTHGMPVDDDVLRLARETFRFHGTRPLLLERDNHVPPLNTLCEELVTVTEFIHQARSEHEPATQTHRAAYS
ncbi:DUF692 domain-containing protein [Erwinia sp. B116]|uniref:DUF692 domain-containing protein n=1 Tax=Erwinia sp. B116 TaxID=1561024 RepID=UPI000C75FBBA|nr:DUF692 domain-containing protein [Erwinia sp. B116]